MFRNSMIDAAHALAASRRHACSEDLDLLQMMLLQLGIDRGEVHVVQLGAGSGTMALVVLGLGGHLVTVDISEENIHWEGAALENMHWPRNGPQGLLYQTILGDSAETGLQWNLEKNGPWDLLIVDADHHYPSVLADLEAWLPHGRHPVEQSFEGRIFVHDYDGGHGMPPAPEHYPGVKAACDEIFFNQQPMWRGGWSAVFERTQWTGHQSSH